MASFIVVDGMSVKIEPMFAHRTVRFAGPAVTRGTGHATIDSRKVCTVADALGWQWPATCDITGFSTGTGFVRIQALAPEQQDTHDTSGGPLVMVGQRFVAIYEPLVSATSASGTSDPNVPTTGAGFFEVGQRRVSVKRAL
ncbi:hypothetical protein DIE19_28670 [Burkholderia sp. Bp9126]|nr:hypothetical protein DIE19_28670 [Burkholderia sp. Bp9126]